MMIEMCRILKQPIDYIEEVATIWQEKSLMLWNQATFLD